MKFTIIRTDDLRKLTEGFKALANSVETLERNLTDRMDLIEGRLDEANKRASGESAQEIVAGHKPWTQRRAERVMRHFNAEKFREKLTQKVGTDGN